MTDQDGNIDDGAPSEVVTVPPASPRAPLKRGRPARRRPARRRPARRRISERVTLSLVVRVVLALLTFVLGAAVLRDRRQMTTGLVPVQRIPAGVVITKAMVRTVEFPASVPFAGSLLPASAVDSELVAGRTLEAGEPLTRSAVGQSGAPRTVGRVMSIPIRSWGDVGGELVVGDQIDVIDTRADPPVYVVQGATVVDRASGDGAGGVLSSATKLWVSIEVTSDQGLAMAAVIDADKFVVIRSTGADPTVTTASQTAPVPSTSVPVGEGG